MAGDTTDKDLILRPSYYAVIPASVRYCEDLKPSEKLLYGEITALASKSGECWATNQYFAQLYQVSPVSISRWVNALRKHGFINVQMIRSSGTQEIDKRVITVVDPINRNDNTPYQNCKEGINKNVNGGINKNVKENNTSMNNTSINKREIYKEKDDYLTLGEFKNVRLAYEQLDHLKDKFVDWEDRIERLSAYKAQTGRRYKNDYATIIVWARKEEKVPKKEEKKGNMYDGF